MKRGVGAWKARRPKWDDFRFATIGPKDEKGRRTKRVKGKV